MASVPAIDYLWVEYPLGELLVCCTERGICKLSFSARMGRDQGLASVGSWARRRWLGRRDSMRVAGDTGTGSDTIVMTEGEGNPVLEAAAEQIRLYVAGKPHSFKDIPLDITGTPFQLKVWQALADIPLGQVRSYKQIAVAVGSPAAVRAVGGANNRNPLPILIPCHRVIGSAGALTGYASGLQVKQLLLELEGCTGMAPMSGVEL